MRNWGGMKREREPGTCRRPLLWIGEGVRRSKQGLTHLAPESWKSARARNVSQTIALDWGGSQEVKTILSSFGTESWKSASAQNMSQTIALDWGGSQEVKTILSSFGTGILEVRECSDRVADH